MRIIAAISLLMLSGFVVLKAQNGSVSGHVICLDSGQCDDAIITLEHTGIYTEVDPNGYFQINNLPFGNYNLIAFALGYETWYQTITIDSSALVLEVRLKSLEKSLDAIVIHRDRIRELGISRKKSVEGVNIYAAKKTEVVQLANLQANLSTNNARQVFGKITGLNIWESDAAGLQLGVGGRGLSPNRTANFNVRQNGYDISADALGYPEAYYTPPMEALERIEVLRGAASLQYGTQFGGLLNFVGKRSPAAKKWEINSRQTLGSYGYFGSFNSFGGQSGQLNHYSYFQFKRGDSWRENSGFQSITAATRIQWKPSKRWTHELEYTMMNYLAQQPGGLTDAAFNENPRQSFRSRNWFKVNWHLPSWIVTYRPDSAHLFEWRTFGLIAERSSVGNLERINRLDLGGNRNLIKGRFANLGQEFRWMYNWKWRGEAQHSLLGYRVYSGNSRAAQGDGSDGSDPDFAFLHPDNLENSDYIFHNINLAIFWEQLIRLNKKLSITPGIRAEYIQTAADGYYRVRLFDMAGNLIVDNRYEDQKEKARQFVIAGIGAEYAWSNHLNFYANISQNYRAINYTDLRINNPNFRVDSNLRDERGFTADLGFRGEKSGAFIYELTLFYLGYNGRIGQVLKQGEAPLYLDYRFRTNVADSRTYGVEMMAEWNMLYRKRYKAFRFQDLHLFVNLAWIQARYYAPEQKAIHGNQVEMVAPLMLRSGLRYRWKQFRSSIQFAYTASHFSDATNSEWTSSAVEGRIPSYVLMDWSMGWKYKRYTIDASINNLLNSHYFTRRADSYPGPGIIPGEARAFYLTLGVELGK